MIFTFGTPLSYGVLTGPFSDAFGVSPLLLSIAFGVMLSTFFFGSAFVGVFGVRFSARRVLLACATITIGVAPSLYLTDSIVGLGVVLGLYGLALGTFYVLVASVVPRWFDARRGAATGLIFVGNGLGLFLLPPVWQYVLTEFGVRRGFLAVAGVNAVVFLLAALVCRRPRWVEQSTATTSKLLDWLSGLGRTRQFQLLFVGIALAFAWYQLFAAYAVDMFAARGLTAAGASTAFGAVGGVSIVSRIGGGYLGDTAGVRRTFLASLACTSIGLALLLVPLRPILYLGIVILGLGLGATATLYIPLLMGIYASDMDSAVIGVFNVGVGIASLVLPPLGTWVVAYFGGYTVPVALTVSMTLLAILSVAMATRSA